MTNEDIADPFGGKEKELVKGEADVHPNKEGNERKTSATSYTFPRGKKSLMQKDDETRGNVCS